MAINTYIKYNEGNKTMISWKRLFIKYYSIKYLFIPFVLITVISGIASFYAVYTYNKTVFNIIDSVGTAKDIQIELQKQFNSWKIIITGCISFGLLTLFTLIVSWYSAQIIDRFKKKLEFKVAKRTEQLQKANEKISLSEQKYRFLIESTDDIIFTLDNQGTILSVNNAIKKDLKIKPDNTLGKNIFDFIYFEDDNNSFKKQMLLKNIEQALREKQKIKFYAELKTPRMIEPVEMILSLESVKHNDGMEIIGKASKLVENELISSSFMSM